MTRIAYVVFRERTHTREVVLHTNRYLVGVDFNEGGKPKVRFTHRWLWSDSHLAGELRMFNYVKDTQ